jgi:hypothetical protein
VVAQAAQIVLAQIADAVAEAGAFRATVTAVVGMTAQIQRVGESAGSAEYFATLSRSVLHVNDVVLCLPLGGKAVVVLDVIQRASAVTPSLAALAAAGSTASVAVSGRDDVMQVQVIPGGTGIASGSILTVTFANPLANASYDVLPSPNSSAARSLGGVIGATGRGAGGFDLATATALTSGSTYQFGILVRAYG